jgi:hypothetical protein
MSDPAYKFHKSHSEMMLARTRAAFGATGEGAYGRRLSQDPGHSEWPPVRSDAQFDREIDAAGLFIMGAILTLGALIGLGVGYLLWG